MDRIHAGFDPSEIIYTPNCVGPDEIEMAISLGVQINIDHIETLEYIGQHYPDTKICIRINPHVMAVEMIKLVWGTLTLSLEFLFIKCL